MLGSFWDHFGIILGSFWDHFGIILGSFWDLFGNILGSCWEDFGINLSNFGELWVGLGMRPCDRSNSEKPPPTPPIRTRHPAENKKTLSSPGKGAVGETGQAPAALRSLATLGEAF